MTTPTPDQFLVNDTGVVHLPTGVEIRWAGAESPDDFELVPGRTGVVLDNGENYDEADVQAVGVEVLAKLRFSS